jgi:hypothetical protein
MMDVSIELTRRFKNRHNAHQAIDAVRRAAAERGWTVWVRTYGEE